MQLRYSLLVSVLLLAVLTTYAQSPKAIPYQAVARNNSGALISNQSVSLRFSIHDGTATGTVVYKETQTTTTNSLGLFSVNIGQGTIITGTMAGVKWGVNAKFLQVEIDTAGGTTYTDMGTNQLMSVPYALNAGDGATYRWASFHTYDEGIGWAFGNNGALFGGVNPSNWTDNDATASQISPDKDVQRTLFQKKGYTKENALIISDRFVTYSSTDGEVAMVLFRINNTTSAAITWTPSFGYTSYANWNERASITVNGANTWSSGTSGTTSVPLIIPPNRVSTVIFVATSGAPFTISGSIILRSCNLGFISNSLTLPAGLQYVDDLDTATGGWTN